MTGAKKKSLETNNSPAAPEPNPDSKAPRTLTVCLVGGVEQTRLELTHFWSVWMRDGGSLWQNHLNYPGSSALAITIKATPTQTHFKRNNS